MINVNKEYVGEIPLLHVVQQEKSDKALPFIIFLHGYTSAKEHNLHFAFLLAEKGFRVVLPDAPFHGERAKKEAAVLDPLFWEIVIHGVDELDVIRQHYLRSGLIDPFYIGVAGTSMGAIMTYGGLSQYEWIHTAVSLMGTPYYVQFAKSHITALQNSKSFQLTKEEIDNKLSLLATYDLSIQVEKLAQRPLMIWHGEEDVVVPYRFSEEFQQQIRPHYKDETRLKFISTPEIDHKIPRDIVLETVSWFMNTASRKERLT